ncbi:solute carrier family 35 member G1-like [Argiope bruennichi]|uniref:solute carrier family 35 member G1-like n=1 Tax=Argiope bruennichi TaxID=94029 RepID=UPI002493E6C5|nr:solute carrier family 35 member G1-like [Argiope bruennichi]XP_055936440.1 solute carrier family 35 member G1-like [Argiope bruennichi]XP_055936441.1 solute carrier family 35 member G1-like [Argiope bruennichi]
MICFQGFLQLYYRYKMYRRKTFHLPPVSSQDDKTDITAKSKFSVFKGLLLAMLSGVFYSAAAVIVKQMKNLHPGQLSVYRFIAILVMSMPQTVKCGENPFGPKDLRLLLVLRGIFGATNLFLNFLAFRYLPLGEAAVIIFSVPVFVTVAARIFLKEPCGIFQSVTVFLTVIGIIFTAKIPSRLMGKAFVYTSENIFGLLASVGSLLFSTCRFIVIRKVKSVHHAVIMFNFGWVAIIETVTLTLIIGDFQWHKCGVQSFYILLLGLLSYGGQTLLTMALQCELAGPVSTMRAAADIVLAFMWQTFLFHDIPDGFSITGAVLVGFSVVFVGLRKWVSSLPEDSPLHKKLRWIVS